VLKFCDSLTSRSVGQPSLRESLLFNMSTPANGSRSARMLVTNVTGHPTVVCSGAEANFHAQVGSASTADHTATVPYTSFAPVLYTSSTPEFTTSDARISYTPIAPVVIPSLSGPEITFVDAPQTRHDFCAVGCHATGTVTVVPEECIQRTSGYVAVKNNATQMMHSSDANIAPMPRPFVRDAPVSVLDEAPVLLLDEAAVPDEVNRQSDRSSDRMPEFINCAFTSLPDEPPGLVSDPEEEELQLRLLPAQRRHVNFAVPPTRFSDRDRGSDLVDSQDDAEMPEFIDDEEEAPQPRYYSLDVCVPGTDHPAAARPPHTETYVDTDSDSDDSLPDLIDTESINVTYSYMHDLADFPSSARFVRPLLFSRHILQAPSPYLLSGIWVPYLRRSALFFQAEE
jgi:hypothetical protein